MKINAVNINNKMPPSFFGVAVSPACQGDTYFCMDIFVKNVKNAPCPVINDFDTKIKQIYDDTFNMVCRNVPILSELNYQKPKFSIEKNKENALARYTINSNTICVSPDLKDDFYIFFEKDKEGKLTTHGISSKKNKSQKFKEIKKKYPKCTAIKLNDDEKELYLAAVISHELRHSIQNHLIASTSECAEEFKKAKTKNEPFVLGMSKYSIAVKSLAKKINLNGTNPSMFDISADIEALHAYDYIKNYKPKKMLDSSTLLEFQSENGKKYGWSVKNHLLKSVLTSGKEPYFTKPLEIDAFLYQAQFIENAAKSTTENNSIHQKGRNFRPEIVSALKTVYLSNAKRINELAENGYPPPIEL